MGSCDTCERVHAMKAVLRREYIKKRGNLPEAECAALSSRICNRILDSSEYKNASTILLYKAYNNEVDTDLIFERARFDGKKVAYPVSDIVDRKPCLKFYEVKSHDQFVTGYRGISEPDPAKDCTLFEGCADLCIVPGVVFDRNCHRIGYGKGFYDRYISLNDPHIIIGLAYDMQIADVFDTEECDRAVDMVITENGIYYR